MCDSVLRTYILYSDVHALDRAFYVGEFLSAHMGVDLRGLAALVSQQFLYVAQVGATFEQVSSVAVAQPMEGGGFFHPALCQCLFEHGL